LTPEHDDVFPAGSGKLDSGSAPEPEPKAPDAPGEPSIPRKWQWVLGVAIVALLAFPLIQRMRQPADAGSSTTTAKPSDADVLVQRSADLYNAGKYQESIAASQEALKLNPRYALAYNNIAVDYLQLKMYDMALASVKQALQIQPDFALAGGNLTWILNEQAKANGTAPKSASTTAPVTPDDFIALSQQKYNAGQYQECIDAAMGALKLQPGMPEAYNNISVSYIQLGMYDKAIENAQLALRSKPDYDLAKGNLNWALSKKNESKK
jgi:tetratricopeptide (TPR) repeat protein